VTEANGTWVGLAYDAAHRRTAVSDSDGNRIEYALDNAGEVIGETVRDPKGVLVRSLARVMDALGRVQQQVLPGDASLYGDWAQGGTGTGTSPSGWVPLAGDNQTFNATRVWRVRYGADTRWAEREVYGVTPCTYQFFGDPAPGTAKSCQRYVGAAPPPPVAAAAVSRYEYDGEGKLTKQTLAPDGLNLQTQLSYDALERVQDSTDPKGGQDEPAVRRRGWGDAGHRSAGHRHAVRAQRAGRDDAVDQRGHRNGQPRV
jgi:YD repeat-containing protein